MREATLLGRPEYGRSACVDTAESRASEASIALCWRSRSIAEASVCVATLVMARMRAAAAAASATAILACSSAACAASLRCSSSSHHWSRAASCASRSAQTDGWTTTAGGVCENDDCMAGRGSPSRSILRQRSWATHLACVEIRHSRVDSERPAQKAQVLIDSAFPWKRVSRPFFFRRNSPSSQLHQSSPHSQWTIIDRWPRALREDARASGHADVGWPSRRHGCVVARHHGWACSLASRRAGRRCRRR
jgi:hypothetical protein